MSDEAEEKSAEVGRRLKQARSHLGMTGEALAEAIGIPFRTYQRYESGKNTPKMAMLRRLQQFGVSVDWLVSGAGAMMGFTHRQSSSHGGLRETDQRLLGRVLDGVLKVYAEEKQPLAPIDQGEIVGPIYDIVVAMDNSVEQQGALRYALEDLRKKLRTAAAR